jgi:sulfotransferase
MRIHFIAGLPRSGSSLLSGILRQNPRFQAGISSPLADIFANLARSMSGFNDSSIFIDDEQRRRMLRSVVNAYFPENSEVVFDTNRVWCAFLPAIAELFPEARIVCCVRNPVWVLDSIETHVQRNGLSTSRLFNWDVRGNVYTRVETLMGKDGIVKRALGNLRQAWFGEHARRIVAIRYESLTGNPAETIAGLYQAIGEAPFDHDFARVEYDEPQYDAILGLPGFHRVSGPVRINRRETILPPDIFKQHDICFWDEASQNPRGVEIL